jgi:uroporphyrinogen III methyltransferase/synthase
VLIPRAREARDVLPEKLAEAGCPVTVLPVYDTRPVDQDPAELIEAITAGDIHYVTFTSSSTVKNFFARIPAEVLKASQVKTACIGPITAATLAEYGFIPDVSAAAYTVPALAEAVIADARSSS